jgi:two-component SAPR family response regulator
MPLETLVIDDDADIRDILAITLSLHGHMIKCAATREEALRIFKQVPSDIVILDWYMEGMTAPLFVNQIRELKPEVRIVLITSGDEVKEKAALLRSDSYVGKPFDGNEMIQTIDRLIAS